MPGAAEPKRSPTALRRAVIASAGAALLWLTLAATVDQVLGPRSPAIAVRWGAGAAAPRAVRAESLVQPGAGPERLAEAEALARSALRAEPISVAAVRTLGQVAALRADLARADRLFAYGERLSRRDLLTQLWLIEAKVRREDVPGALLHYDRALRTAMRARPLLFPTLMAAAAEPAVARSLGETLARRPAWTFDFLTAMALDPKASPDALAALHARVPLRPDVPVEREALAAGVKRLVDSGEYRAAFAVYRRSVGAEAALVRDGGFERDPVLAPFDWSFANESDLAATRDPRGDGHALALRAANGRSGELARQLLLLSPGAYRLSFVAGSVTADPIARPTVTVACAGGGARLAEFLVEPAGGEGRRQTAALTVPAGCAAQQLVISAPAGLGDATVTPFIDDVAVARVR